VCRFVSVGGQEEQPWDWKSSIMVRGSASWPMAVRMCWLLLSLDAKTVMGEAVLCEKIFFRASILFERQILCDGGRITRVIVLKKLVDGRIVVKQLQRKPAVFNLILQDYNSAWMESGALYDYLGIK